MDILVVFMMFNLFVAVLLISGSILVGKLLYNLIQHNINNITKGHN